MKVVKKILISRFLVLRCCAFDRKFAEILPKLTPRESQAAKKR
jgi:hypothetical protein